MRLLLDAHTLLWWLANDPTLTPSARALIADPANEVFVSAATLWEIAIKRELGKLVAPAGVASVLAVEGFDEIAVTGADGEAAARLRAHHRDPFDRMLVAQAARLGLTIVTRDTAFASYGAPTTVA